MCPNIEFLWSAFSRNRSKFELNTLELAAFSPSKGNTDQKSSYLALFT